MPTPRGSHRFAWPMLDIGKRLRSLAAPAAPAAPASRSASVCAPYPPPYPPLSADAVLPRHPSALVSWRGLPVHLRDDEQRPLTTSSAPSRRAAPPHDEQRPLARNSGCLSQTTPPREKQRLLVTNHAPSRETAAACHKPRPLARNSGCLSQTTPPREKQRLLVTSNAPLPRALRIGPDGDRLLRGKSTDPTLARSSLWASSRASVRISRIVSAGVVAVEPGGNGRQPNNGRNS
jgi:hypothetical protein